MENVLFINACVRPGSRTLRLARRVLGRIGGEVTEVCLAEENIAPLNGAALSAREEFCAHKNFDHPMFRHAKDFAAADSIVIAAPFWDLSFPALLRIYLEAVTVRGLTFFYTPQGWPSGLCKAKRLIYVTTAGGPIMEYNMGYDYVKVLAEKMFSIPEVRFFGAENLDVFGADVEGILKKAEEKIDEAEF